MVLKTIVTTFALALLCAALGGHALRLVHSSTRLPSQRTDTAAVYDGDNSIYILGGHRSINNKLDEIVRYSLDTDSVQVVARLGYTVEGGSAVLAGEDVVYFGGFSNRSYIADISLFSPATNSVTIVGQLPQPLADGAAVWDPEARMAYIIGGGGPDWEAGALDTVYSYNASSHQVEQVAQLPEGRELPGAVWDDANQVVYVFGGYNGHNTDYHDILEFSPSTGTVSRIPVALPYSILAQRVVSGADGRSYIISSEGPIKFSHDSHQLEELEVEMWPPYFHFMSSVYVPKLNRIYMFGGYRHQSEGTDLISYVDLG